MKKLFVATSVLFCLASQKINAQDKPHFNHTTIYVVDMNKSAEFYEKVLMLERISEPFHDNKHIWEKIGEHSELHIVQGAKEVSSHDINIHLAFSVPSVEEFAKHLDAMNVKYGNWNQTSKEPQVRPDGIKQIYFQDPDGYWIEVNDDKF
jgi:lactoylglutathione lyase